MRVCEPRRFGDQVQPHLQGAVRLAHQFLARPFGLVIHPAAIVIAESAVGAHLANAAAPGECERFYWREGNREVDFVLRSGRVVVGLEVTSGHAPLAHSGLIAFSEAFKPKRTLLVGGDGIPVEEFLSRPVTDWLQP